MVSSEPEENPTPETLGKRLPKSRSRRPSRSSSSCSSSLLSSCHSSSGGSPAMTPPKPSGIPFSWEDQPGVPKHLQLATTNSNSAANSRSRHGLYAIGNTGRLPPPPLRVLSNRYGGGDSVYAAAGKKVSSDCMKVHDPFFMALVECSKDKMGADLHGWKTQKNCKSVRGLLNLDRFQASCKANVAVLESQVVLRRPGHRSSYGLLANRSA